MTVDVTPSRPSDREVSDREVSDREVSGPEGPRPGVRHPGRDLEPNDLRDLLGVPFTPEQIIAATAPLEPGVIVAGAGSGKTSVMAARVVWLVATGQVAPDGVLGLTFTTKAAGELTDRIRRGLEKSGAANQDDGNVGNGDGMDNAGNGQVGNGGAGGVPEQGRLPDGHPGDDRRRPQAGGEDADGEPVVSTYHSFAKRLVTEHALRLGLEPGFRLLADATRFQLAGRVLRRYRGQVEALTRPLSMLIGDLVSLEAECSEHLVDAGVLAGFDRGWLADIEAAIIAGRDAARNKGHLETLARMALVARSRRELAAMVAEYRTAKSELDVIDFGDLVTLAVRLADEVPDVGALERSRSRVVLLDEYQDTSVAQRRMLAGLFGGGHPVTAVGDPCQAIYGWRGASVANLDGFPVHFRRVDGEPAGMYELTVNQRSGGRLLHLANTVATALRARHRVAQLRPRPDVAEHGETVVALHPTWAGEVRWVAATLREIIDTGRAGPGECAVLVRARSDVPALYAALLAEGLPVEVVGLGGLLSLPEVADVIATLEVLDDPTANAALMRLLTGPRMRLGRRDLAALGRAAREAIRVGVDRSAVLDRAGPDGPGVGQGPVGQGPTDALDEAVAGVDPCDVVALADVLDDPGSEVSPQGRARLRMLGGELRHLRAHIDEPLLDVIHRIVEITGLDVELAASPEAVTARRRDTLAAFIDVAAGFVGLDNDGSITAFLAFLRAAQDHERGLDATTPSGADAVQLMTVHKSKGLEWEVVAVPNLSRKVFPITTVRSKWTTSPSVLPTSLRGDGDDLPVLRGYGKPDLADFAADCDDYLEREERRLGYVAFTRAKSTLLGSGHWWGPSQRRLRGPSAFLDELYDHVRAGHGQVAVWAPRPSEDETNPQLAGMDDLDWPLPYEPASYARRRAVAGRVAEHLTVLTSGRPLSTDRLEEMAPEERQLLAELDRDVELLLAEARRARRPSREVELPRALTASQVVRLRSDPAGLARDLARPMPRRPVPQARRGTAFHAWVEGVFEQAPLLDPEDLPGAADEGVDDSEIAVLREAFLASSYGRRRPFAVEAPFELLIAGRAVRGRIDAVYDLGGGRWEVVDWKTGRHHADAVQLAVYRLAWARLRGVGLDAVDAAFLYVRSGEVARPALLSEPELEALLTDP
ncbi:ATP-dependent DNA helicase [Frankia sp. Cppng1_Ct_nod]|uniref:ATP-dependent helicase n=1 Tax=Frankia sp. Cppng1_Ct_nod TaxID=2897162 RepID=UPI00104162E8|nr:ATP-dependent DNA helicase [Frankia sp. Cppng1_Ct_nod]